MSAPSRFPRPCLKCQNLHRDYGDYCVGCRGAINRQREQDPVRKAKKKNLYNSHYRRVRQYLRQNATHCHLCQQPFTDRSEITADHIIAGDPSSPLAAAHASCNYSRGNKAAQ